MSLAVPAGLAAALGAPATAWLAALPALAESFLDRWALRRDGDPMHGNTALVLPVRRADDTPAVLKLVWPHPEGEHEALALAEWAGSGAVRLFATAPWVLLLERLDPHRDLLAEPIDSALAVLAGLLRRLDRPALPGLRTVRDVAARWAATLAEENASLGRPVPAELVDLAVALCVELGPLAGDRLVNEDAHYANVLGATREPWLLIDPKPIAGDPEFGLFPLLTNRFDPNTVLDRLATACRLTGLDADLARRWALVRAVDAWLDARLHAGAFPTADTCARLVAALRTVG